MIENYYTESPVLYSQTTSTGYGSEPGWGTPTTIAAAVNPASGHETFVSGRDVAYADYKLYCSDTVSITVSNRVVYSGDTFNVVFVKDTLNKGHHKKVLLQYVR